LIFSLVFVSRNFEVVRNISSEESTRQSPTGLIYSFYSEKDDMVPQHIGHQSCDQEVLSSTPSHGANVMTVCKLFMPLCLCRQAV